MTPQLPWKPWHQVVTLRDDLRTGELALNQFAADLYEVLMQSGKRPLYEDPRQFFALTYPTHNLRELARDVALRLAGQNDKAVQQLELTYGGGKTHTLITLRHLFHDPVNLPALPAVQEFVQHIGQTLPHARVVALCFDKLDLELGLEVCAPDGQTCRLKQPWSLLAYQLAGNAGLAHMRDDRQPEERTTAPAESVIGPLLKSVTQQGLSVLVLIDEVMLYVRGKLAQDPTARAPDGGRGGPALAGQRTGQHPGRTHPHRRPDRNRRAANPTRAHQCVGTVAGEPARSLGGRRSYRGNHGRGSVPENRPAAAVENGTGRHRQCVERPLPGSERCLAVRIPPSRHRSPQRAHWYR